ncbi:2-dehydro-3-deoxygalactonokinase [uncultured Arcticibacterium sp.]|uniref:2-dehydro-3-deoxygalactonokinase n=1 Tax=uncultured Arcticibacterium sp. TaxID=2173042 RepID=UPI0030F62AAF
MPDIKNIISCDWGTSSFRLRLVDINTEQVLSKVKDSEGISVVNANWLSRDKPSSERKAFFLSVLKEKIKSLVGQNLEKTPVLISGMASSSIGIEELKYSNTPLSVSDLDLSYSKFYDDRDIYIFSGLSSELDVMRGEETIILGCDSSEEELIILPGTHSKHVEVRNGSIIDFKTFMTGEFFNILSTNSILANTVLKPEAMRLDNSYYQKGLEEGFVGNLLNLTFNTRTLGLLKAVSKEDCYHYLSGLLIGAELKSIPENTACVHLVSEGNLLEIYTSALKVLNTSATVKATDSGKAFVNGHLRLYKSLR